MQIGEELSRVFPALAGPLGAEDLDALLAVLEPRELMAGELLFRADETPGLLCLLLSGTLEIVLDPADAVIGRLGPGSFVGEVSFLDGGEATASVVVTTPALVLALERTAFERLRRSSPRSAAALVRAMTVAVASRVRRATDQLEGLRFGSTPPGVLRRPGLMNALRALMGTAS